MAVRVAKVDPVSMQSPLKKALLHLTAAAATCLLLATCSRSVEDPNDPSRANEADASQQSTWQVGGKMTLAQVTSATGADVLKATGSTSEVLPTAGSLAIRFPNFKELTFEDIDGWTLINTRGESGPKGAPFLQMTAVRGSERHIVSDKSAGNNELELDGNLQPGTGFFIRSSGGVYSYPSKNAISDMLDTMQAPEGR